MSKTDEFEATKQIVAVLEPFDLADDRERILRWVRDKLGMRPGEDLSRVTVVAAPPVASRSDQPIDIKAFIDAKNPRTDSQLVAVVAYFHRFVAPDSQRKESIGKEDVLSACRLAGRPRPPRMDQTMVNAFSAGYFDRAERGQYRLNSVGENLVAFALPGGSGSEKTSLGKKSKRRKKTSGGRAQSTARGRKRLASSRRSKRVSRK